MEHPTVLVFVEFPNPEFPTGGFLNHLAYPDVELVGFYHLDDDESVQQARDEYEEEFTAELQEQAEQFEQRGVRTTFSIEFNHDSIETRQRIAKANKVDAILTLGGANGIGKVLIASRHTKGAKEKVTNLLNIVNRDDLISVGLVHVADPDDPEGEDEGKRVLEEVASILTSEGIPSVQISREVRTGEDVAFELQQAARSYDLLVLGETEQDLGDRVFGPVNEYVVNETDIPVLIVR